VFMLLNLRRQQRTAASREQAVAVAEAAPVPV
jgi:hypothetical protein